MIVRSLNFDYLDSFEDDVVECYIHNKLIFDSQNDFREAQDAEILWYISKYIASRDSVVLGIFDENEKKLWGIIIFDNIRFGLNNRSCAEVHIATNRVLWGKEIKDIYEEVLKSVPFTTIYCSIPAIAVHAIRMCRVLGFKKTGYIPEALPYINSKGEEKLYDIQIWSYARA